jgi:hypothetical protein
LVFAYCAGVACYFRFQRLNSFEPSNTPPIATAPWTPIPISGAGAGWCEATVETDANADPALRANQRAIVKVFISGSLIRGPIGRRSEQQSGYIAFEANCTKGCMVNSRNKIAIEKILITRGVPIVSERLTFFVDNFYISPHAQT